MYYNKILVSKKYNHIFYSENGYLKVLNTMSESDIVTSRIYKLDKEDDYFKQYVLLDDQTTFTVLYNYNGGKTGFQNSITVKAENEAKAIETAKEAVKNDICRHISEFKKFTFKIIN